MSPLPYALLPILDDWVSIARERCHISRMAERLVCDSLDPHLIKQLQEALTNDREKAAKAAERVDTALAEWLSTSEDTEAHQTLLRHLKLAVAEHANYLDRAQQLSNLLEGLKS